LAIGTVDLAYELHNVGAVDCRQKFLESCVCMKRLSAVPTPK
jgi:hypothetical protein